MGADDFRQCARDGAVAGECPRSCHSRRRRFQESDLYRQDHGEYARSPDGGRSAPPVAAVCRAAPRHVFIANKPYPFPTESRPTPDTSAPSRPVDPDAEFVARVQAGETDAFEELVRRHFRRIFGTLSGILGNTDAARDATQEVFLKAFEHIRGFQGRSKFSTWLTSIAINSGTELLRQRKGEESLDEGTDDEGFRPRLIQAWSETPEQLFAASQVCDLVRQAVLRLPQKYRVAVLLRDINQLSTEEAAASLGIGVPAFKARILRGRLMLRESLAPHFARQARSAKC